MDRCSLFKGTGIKTKKQSECEVCPLQKKCPEEILDEAMAKIMEILGRYLDEQKRTK